MLRTATEEPQTNLAQTIASNLEGVIDPAAALALGIDQVAVPLQVIVRAVEAQAQLIVQAEALEQVIVLAVAEPEHDLAVAELERGQVRGVAVRLRIKSAIAARPRGLAQVPRAADLAVVVVEIMPEPAATGVGTAWEAAATVAVVAVVATVA
jgi:hypothetical protein